MFEQTILISCVALTAMLSIALLVLMARRGLGVVPRVYVALVTIFILTLCQTAITGTRPFGYLPEIGLSITVAVGVFVGLISALWDEGSGSRERMSVFRNLF